MKNNTKLNTIWNMLGLTLNSFNSLFFLIIVNRINGVDIAGVFSFAFSIACLLFVIGIYSGRIYQVSDINNYLNNKEYLVHKIISCILMLLATLIFIFVKNYDYEKNIIILLLCIYKLLEAFSETFYGFLQKNNELYIVGKSLFFKSLTGCIVFFITDYLTRNIVIACIFLNLTSVLYIFLYDIKNSKKYINDSDVIRRYKVISLFKKGFSVFLFSFLAIYIVNVPKYVIDILLDNEAQAIFNIIVMPGTVMSLCGQYIVGPLLNEIVISYEKKEYFNFKKIIFKIIKILMIFGLVVEILAGTVGIPILELVYGIELKNYLFDLLIIIFGAIMYASASVFSTGLITMRCNNMQLIIYVIVSIFAFIFSYIFIRMYGLHGATIAYISTMAVDAILYFIYFKYEFIKLLKKSKL